MHFHILTVKSIVYLSQEEWVGELSMDTALGITQLGQQIIMEWLKDKSLSVVLVDTNIPTISYVQATTAKGIKLIHVLSALYPNEPGCF